MSKPGNEGVTSYYVAENLYLAAKALASEGEREPAPPARVHHVVVIDCSGSMSGDLPELREQLKSKLTKLVKVGDLLTVIWFSGRGQCGVLLCEEAVA